MSSRDIAVKTEDLDSGVFSSAPPESAKNGKNTPKISTKKTIKAPGSAVERSAQACDRCRVKKSKCDGKFPACSSCAAAGLKCIVSDKLSRRSFPKGYTETLEERVRALENENTKLQGLLKLRESQLSNDAQSGTESHVLRDMPSQQARAAVPGPDFSNPFSAPHTHIHDDGCPCCVTAGANSFHERPVSLAGSVYNADDVSLAGSVVSNDNDSSSLLSVTNEISFDFSSSGGVNPAPGAFAAATAIEQMQKKRNIQGSAHSKTLSNGYVPAMDEESKQQLLTELVAASIPRSTAETLFVPTLLAKICQVYGYRSTAARITANAIASLKTTKNDPLLDGKHQNIHARLTALLLDPPEPKLPSNVVVEFLGLLGLPGASLRHTLLTEYFRSWGDVCPIVNKNAFLQNCVGIWQMLETGFTSETLDVSCESVEKLGAILVLMLALALKSCTEPPPDSMSQRYHWMVHEFIKPNCILTKYCSVQSLQILALSLQYFLANGDYITCYELRGRVISMAQQLRMHRCPAAVLGAHHTADRHVQGFLQGERRILFWCIYSLDAFCSLSLGVPRLLKDYEIECAMPFASRNSDEKDDASHANENILIVNNTRLTIFGRVSAATLAYMQYSKVLGSILDSIFSRSGDYDDVSNKALEKERMLDCWRRDLPANIRFETDTHGFLQPASGAPAGEESQLTVLSNHQKLCVFLFYHAKILIFLPVISKYGYHHNVGMSIKEQLSLGKHDVSSVVASMTSIQQSSAQLLKLLKHAFETSLLLPLPLNISQEHARFALLVARGSLDYIKNGPLHQNSKQLLLDTVFIFKSKSSTDFSRGSLTVNSAVLLEYSVMSILGINLMKPGNTLRKKAATAHISRAVPTREVAHANSMGAGSWKWGGIPGQSHAPISQTAVGVQRWGVYSHELLDRHDQDDGHDRHDQDDGHDRHDQHDGHDRHDQHDPHSQHDRHDPQDQHDPQKSPDLPDPTASSGTPDQSDSLSNILDFDPFEMNYTQDLMVNEFVTDGSLGLVPFLKDSSEDPIGDANEMYGWGAISEQ